MFDSRYKTQRERKAAKPTLQSKVRWEVSRAPQRVAAPRRFRSTTASSDPPAGDVSCTTSGRFRWRRFRRHCSRDARLFSVFVVVLVCLILSVLSTVEQHSRFAGELLFSLVRVHSHALCFRDTFSAFLTLLSGQAHSGPAISCTDSHSCSKDVRYERNEGDPFILIFTQSYV